MSVIDKQLVARRFSKAAGTYHEAAVTQQQIACRMMELLRQSLPAGGSLHQVAEIGCGTGFYSRLLQKELHPTRLYLNDICGEMERHCTDVLNEGAVFLPGDAEQIELPSGSDLITSCSTLQWFEYPEAFFKKCSGALRPGGYLAFSTFGEENMREIRRLTGKGLHYNSLQTLKSVLAPHFQILYAGEELVVQSFNTAWDVLRHVKQTGVNGMEEHRWGPAAMRYFQEEYTRLFTGANGVSLTYHPIYIIAKKKEIL